MRLRHSTLVRHLPAIQRRGLLCSKSKGKLRVVWLHAPGQSGWGVVHVAQRHGSRLERVVTLELSVPRRWLRRSRKGLWYSVKDIPPERIGRLVTLTEIAGPFTD